MRDQDTQKSTGQQSTGRADRRLDEWVDQHSDALYRFALTRVKDRHEIEDLLQETFLSAIRSQDSFQGRSQVRTWLIAILRLKIIDFYRKQNRRQQLGNELDEETYSEPSRAVFREDRIAAWNDQGVPTLEDQEFWVVFRSCAEKLPPTLAQTYLLREMDGLAPEIVCKMLNISNQNLAVRIFRARTALRDCLDKNWFSRD